jgi:KUP system potassium uptake protein
MAGMHTTQESSPARARWALRLAAAGVVYGDIGTSPLYAWNEVRHSGTLGNEQDILGAASLILWTVTLGISVKYVQLVLRADNQGEGGTFALMGLVQRFVGRGRAVLLTLLTFAACLLYADGLITPSISVLSALEGLAVANDVFEPYVVPLSLGVLTGLFYWQYLGTARLGAVFGAVIVLWFGCIAALGVAQIGRAPEILWAVAPHHALGFLASHTLGQSASALGAIVLVITGGEALYADLGHFGAPAIRWTWNFVAWPALLLNYLGQGAYLLGGGEVQRNSVFFSMVPEVLLYPAVALATAATVIASQALISGAFSLTRSAVHLGLLPRVQVVHTSEHVEGQIYLPLVNVLLWVGCCALVLAFQSSSALAAAYGLAVMGVVTTTTLSLAFLARAQWGWSLGVTALVFGTFLVFDGAYLAANALKLLQGAWMPLVLASALYLVMRTWQRGRTELAQAYRRVPRVPLRELVARRGALTVMPRAMVFLVSEAVLGPDDLAPVLLLKFVDRYGALPKHVTLFTVVHEPDMPRYPGERTEVTPLGGGIVSVRMHVGYLEQPDVRQALSHLKQQGQIKIHASRWTIVTGREEIVVSHGGPLWRAQLLAFRAMVRVSAQIHGWFGLGHDTGVSKEIIAVRASQDGMEIPLALELALTQTDDSPRLAR